MCKELTLSTISTQCTVNMSKLPLLKYQRKQKEMSKKIIFSELKDFIEKSKFVFIEKVNNLPWQVMLQLKVYTYSYIDTVSTLSFNTYILSTNSSFSRKSTPLGISSVCV